VRSGSLGLLRVMVVLLVFGAGIDAARADDADALALAVKAAFLYKFEPFVSWPAQAFPSPASPFNLCVVGDDPFGPLLDRAVSGQQTAGHAIAVLRLKSVSPDAHCQLLFIATADPGSARQAEAAVAGTAVLTITDSIDDPADRGMINFVIADNRVRFQIDAVAAAQSGLTISSKLLSLAVSVRSGP
jgi:YfiR/HmsC-like